MTIDPYSRIFSSDSKFVKSHGKARDEAWSKIEELVSNEPDIYDPKKRGKLFRDTINEKHVSPKTLYKSCRKYWRYGKTPNALLPQMTECSNSGRKRGIRVKYAMNREKLLPKRGEGKVFHDISPGMNPTATHIKSIKQALEELIESGSKLLGSCPPSLGKRNRLSIIY